MSTMAETFANNSKNGGNPSVRRSGNHHPNVWTDDFIHSLNSPYGDSTYFEQRETVINELHAMFSSNGKEEGFNLLQNISLVDVLQRLGIDPYFQEEIKVALDYIHKCWNDNTIEDLNMIALGFRILRLNRYEVSSDVFEKFKGGEGQFSGFGCTHEDTRLAIMLNLYKASELDFPGEDILKEVRAFALAYLEDFMKEYSDIKEKKNPLLMEIDYALKYPWRTRIPRWEAWNFIEILKQQNLNGTCNIYKIPNTYSQKLLELSILDFNILQAQHQSEMKLISKWWKHSRVTHLDFFRHRHIEFYFWWTCSLFGPGFNATRIGFAKLVTTLSLLDDIYDTYGTVDELRPFTTALIRWDASMIDNLPDYMKLAFKFTYSIHKEIASEAERKHGAFVHKYIQSCWESYILSYMEEAEWIASNHTPGFDEYLINGESSGGLRIVMVLSLLLVDAPLSDEIMEQLDSPSSKLRVLVSLLARVVDDVRDFEDEKDHGETASSIECYMKDNPASTREDALNYVTNLIDGWAQEANKEFLMPSHLPDYCRNLYFNAGMRGIFFLYKDIDGITNSHKKVIRDAITKVLMEPIMP